MGNRLGDYAVQEQKIPAGGDPKPWETCMTLNGHWGYHKMDQKWKPTETLVRHLIDIASKGGNFLLNVGPTAEGVIPAPWRWIEPVSAPMKLLRLGSDLWLRLMIAAALAATPYTAVLYSAEVPAKSGALSAPDKDSAEMAWWRDSMKTRDDRLAWWREARFGMFVHWGVYSGLGGTWQGTPVKGYAEHIQRMLKIPIPVYREQVAGKFNPAEFNADEWIRTAKEAGMGYFIITAKHHDGFAMYDSKVSSYNIVQATPFRRDPMKELKAACRKYGVKFGFYYSHAFDWGDANAPGNDWDYENPGGDRLLHGGRNWWEASPELLPKVRRYVDEKAIPQLLELIKNYDPDIVWFDTPHKLPDVESWSKPNELVAWPVRLNHPATFDVMIAYDAEAGSAAGSYTVKLGGETLSGTVKQGNNVAESLGRVRLQPGTFEIQVVPGTIQGGELMRLRSLKLTAIN